MYKSILKEGIDEFYERKSHFIGYSKPVETEEEALDFIDQIRSDHSDATHHCTAYIVGEDMLIQRYNDDGEPSGTAGIPMLDVLKREELTNIVLVVVRYFGGILLGAGGLTRAYAKGANIAVQAGIPVNMVECILVSLKYEYSFHGSIENYLNTNNIAIADTIYTNSVDNHILIKKEDLEPIKSYLVDLTSDNIDIDIIDELVKPEKDGELILD